MRATQAASLRRLNGMLLKALLNAAATVELLEPHRVTGMMRATQAASLTALNGVQ